MNTFTVRTVNSEIIANSVLEAESAAAAQAVGIRGAVAMVVDDVARGATSAATTVMVGDGENVLSYVAVSLSIATLSTS